MTAAPRTRTRRSILIVAVATVMTVAGGVSAFLVLEQNTTKSIPVVDDGPTLYQAIAGVNQSLRNVTGGPWGLFSIYGVAAEAPFSASVVGYPLDNLTANACQAQFNGLTLWNGTMPAFDGSLSSGTAPFWQFAYFSNVSQQILVVTSAMGTSHAYSPMPVNGPCHPWYDLGNPEDWVRQLAPFLTNSPNIAQPAMDAMGKLSWFYRSSPWAEIYTTGPGVFDGFGDLGGFAGVILDRCGLLGASNIQPLLLWAESFNGTNGGYSNETTNCAVLNYPYFAGYGSYDVIPGSPGSSLNGGTLQLAVPFQVGIIEHNQTTPFYYNAWGLANWMTSWNLTNSSGDQLPLQASGCDSWVPSVSDCEANASGWYAVVLSASGEWVNSYGLNPNGTRGWAEPVTALVSHQQLVIVVPSSWNVTGDVMTVKSTVATSTVLGTIAL
ncbi:MAG TPA: hypothetical protein VEH57_06690 [Thermoplasmata archaeon]|nr:hypothetical protein [Thermoplasmata archaeon]